MYAFQTQQDTSDMGNASGGAIQGASMGAPFGPHGMAIGAAIGTATGLLKAAAARRKAIAGITSQEHANRGAMHADAAKARSASLRSIIGSI